MPSSYWIETLGCPKNAVDSEKLAFSLGADGYERASSSEAADVIVVNTCAFIDAARAESVETILELARQKRNGAKLVVTGCFAARAGAELAAEMPEIDLVTDVGVPITFGPGPRWRPREASVPALDLLTLPRPPARAPWAYVKVAEGCDRACGFCAIPSFRGKQRSRTAASILAEVDALGVQEIVLVAQDLASFGRDLGEPGALIPLVEAVASHIARVRLLYLYPSSLTDGLIEAIAATGVPYYDLSLQHVSSRLLRSMRRVGSAQRFLERIERIRRIAPEAALRSSFILGYPGETEEDHDELLSFLTDAQLDWVGLFPFSKEEGTYATRLGNEVPEELALERLRECAEVQDRITASRRAALVGTTTSVLVDARGVGRSHREAPEIDGIVKVPTRLRVGEIATVQITASLGTDLVAESVPLGVADEMLLGAR